LAPSAIKRVATSCRASCAKRQGLGCLLGNFATRARGRELEQWAHRPWSVFGRSAGSCRAIEASALCEQVWHTCALRVAVAGALVRRSVRGCCARRSALAAPAYVFFGGAEAKPICKLRDPQHARWPLPAIATSPPRPATSSKATARGRDGEHGRADVSNTSSCAKSQNALLPAHLTAPPARACRCPTGRGRCGSRGAPSCWTRPAVALTRITKIAELASSMVPAHKCLPWIGPSSGRDWRIARTCLGRIAE